MKTIPKIVLVFLACLLITSCKQEEDKNCKMETYYYPSSMKMDGMCQDLGAGVYYCLSQRKICKEQK